MKLLFWFLATVNVSFFAFMQWGTQLMAEDNLAQQPPLYAEKIKLLDASAMLQATFVVPVTPPVAMPAASSVEPLAASPVQLTMQPDQPAMPAPAQPLTKLSPNESSQAKSISKVCLEWGEFSGTERVRANAALAELNLGEGLVQRQNDSTTGYWVYMPPLKTRAAVNKKIAELKGMGVEDYFIVQESGRWKNSISLGLFKTEEAANNYLAYLRSKGVRSAVVGARANNIKITIFMLKNLDKDVTKKIHLLHKKFAGSELKQTACN